VKEVLHTRISLSRTRSATHTHTHTLAVRASPPIPRHPTTPHSTPQHPTPDTLSYLGGEALWRTLWTNPL
jgi:hypothetical protein